MKISSAYFASGWSLLATSAVICIATAASRVPGHTTWSYLADTMPNGMPMPTGLGFAAMCMSLIACTTAVALLFRGAEWRVMPVEPRIW